MSEIIGEIYVDRRMEEYGDIMTSEQGAELGNRTEAPKLRPLLDRLMLNWRSTSYLAAMPGMFVRSQEMAIEGYARSDVNDTVLLAMTQGMLDKLAVMVPEIVSEPGLATKLRTATVRLAADVRDARAKAKLNFESDKYWDDYLKIAAFFQYIWSSERLSYQAVYNAYEDFLIEVINVKVNKPNLRTSSPEFKATLDWLGATIYEDCWTSRPILELRLLRHSLAHSSGRITPNMVKENVKPLNHPEVSQVYPENVRAAVSTLAPCVLKILDAASPLPEYN